MAEWENLAVTVTLWGCAAYFAILTFVWTGLLRIRRSSPIAVEDCPKVSVIVAAKNGSLGIVQQLITSGADVNKTAENGSTALMFATREDNLSVVKMLVQHGAKIKTANKEGVTSLQIAKTNDFTRIEKYLNKILAGK